MPTRVSKKKLAEMEDTNSLAARIVASATGQALPVPPSAPVKMKNAAAVALGKLGASKGGKARAEKLSLEKRREIAKKAALTRWRT